MGVAFLLAVPVMAVLLVAGAVLPEHRLPGGGGLDLLGAVLSLTAVLPGSVRPQRSGHGG